MGTTLLEKAFSKAAKLTEAEQNSLGKWILAELESEQRWKYLFNQSEKELADLAKEALEDYNSGQTKNLDIKDL
ncbi:MAG: hypothetical protein ACLFQM_11885 [Fidelibacterota bacterium]